MLKRVVITGLGALTPIGNNAALFWQNLVAGKSGAAPITRFDSSLFKTHFACELKDFNPEDHLEKADIKRADPFTQYALVAADEAIADSGFDISKMDPFDVGVIWGSGQGGMETFENQVSNYALGNGEPRFSPFFVPRLITNMSSGMISIRHGLMGINYTTVSACATSNTAIMDAFNYIRLGKAKIIVTGGSEAPITPASFGGFNAIRALSTHNENPAEACRPFDADRDGFVMGEGAGALVLEDYEHAKRRGAHVYAEILGAAMTADAYHTTATHPEGRGAARAMQDALKEAGVTMAEVDYINVHATSTTVGDQSEINALLTVSPAWKTNTVISSTKSMTGHLLGAAGAIEAIAAVYAIQQNVIPPTINTSRLDPMVPDHLRILTGHAIDHTVNVAMSNTFGFGGHNGIVVFGRLN